jgi:hypothetical protein
MKTMYNRTITNVRGDLVEDSEPNVFQIRAWGFGSKKHNYNFHRQACMAYPQV